jgi:DNA-binding IclR family transcriptional regulator
VRYRTLVGFSADALRRVWEKTRETVTVHVRIGPDRLCIEEIESPEAITYRAGVGRRVPLHAGSAGKVQLAFLPDAERAAALKQVKLLPLTARTITNRARLIEELVRIRRLGYAMSFGESFDGVAAVSVPLFDSNGRLVASVSVLGPESRLPSETLERHAALLKSEIQPLPLAYHDFGLPRSHVPRSNSFRQQREWPGRPAMPRPI